tara:strand:+ start:267 stop:596 length:330 start_codon:yes stop_codon:yes gene_type:complete
MNPQKNKGDKAEREVAKLLTELTGKTIRRKLGAGRTNAAGGDTGDIELDGWAIQVCDYKDKSTACLKKPREAEEQKENLGAKNAATFVRFRGGVYRVVMTPEQWIRCLN